MASSRWSFWPFSKGASSSPANFLHLSRTNVETICKLTSSEEPLNPYQCRSMSTTLERTMRSIERIVDSVDDISLVCGSAALENFYRVSEKARQLVGNCCRDDWWQESAFQIQNEEAFQEVLLETSLGYNTICKLVDDINRSREFLYQDLRESSTFDPSSADEVSKDRVALRDRLQGLANDENNSDSQIQSQYLGKYLLGRVNYALQHSNYEDFDVRSFRPWSDGNGPEKEWSEKSDFLGGNVCKTTWLGVPCAKKLFQDEMQEDEWLAEAKILASLNHPNIVKFLYCNKYKTEHTGGHFIAMEQMDTNLGSFIKRLKEEGAKLSLFSALDIILQIAYGMCYIHENGIAHRDLKTSNVVVCRIVSPQLQYSTIFPHLQVKVADFGISKMKLQDKSNTISRPKIGTTVYMPPEAFSHGRANWFKADVYSFSVMCSVVLSGGEPFRDIKRKDIHRAICSGKRPMLPGDIPEELASVIREGWASDRNLRPKFFDICTRLEKLRHLLLLDHTLGSSFKQEQLYDLSSLYIERMLRRRSKAREHARSCARLQIPIEAIEEEEWFDGDKEYMLIPEVSSEDARNDRRRNDSSLGGMDINLFINTVPVAEADYVAMEISSETKECVICKRKKDEKNSSLCWISLVQRYNFPCQVLKRGEAVEKTSEGNGVVDPLKAEFLCPTCRRLANVLLPDVDASLSSKILDMHDDGKGVDETGLEWRRFWQSNKNLESAMDSFVCQVLRVEEQSPRSFLSLPSRFRISQALWEGLVLNVVHCEVETREGYVQTKTASSSSAPIQLSDECTWGGHPSHWLALRELGRLAMLSNTLPGAVQEKSQRLQMLWKSLRLLGRRENLAGSAACTGSSPGMSELEKIIHEIFPQIPEQKIGITFEDSMFEGQMREVKPTRSNMVDMSQLSSSEQSNLPKEQSKDFWTIDILKNGIFTADPFRLLTLLLIIFNGQPDRRSLQSMVKFAYTVAVLQTQIAVSRLGVEGPEVESSVQRACLPFLRRAAMLVQIITREDFRGQHGLSGAKVMEFLNLQLALQLPDCSQILRPQVHGARETLATQLLHLHDPVSKSFTFELRKVPRKAQFHKLPRIFQELLLENVYSKKCVVCGEMPADPAICLICGILLCCGTDCCKRNGIGECSRHASEESAGLGIFLLLRTSQLLLVRNNRTFMGLSLYLDIHGEEDLLWRSQLFYLSDLRLNEVRRLWMTAAFDYDSYILCNSQSRPNFY